MAPEEAGSVQVGPSLRLLYTSSIEVDPPMLVGKTHYGERRIIHIKRGVFAGPRLSGKVLPGGADWQVMRTDGITELEARYTLETDDGSLIYVLNRGIRRGPKEVMERLARGEQVDPSEYYFRTTPVFETGAPKYQWLHGLVAVATGERRAKEVVITVYEIT
jgi:Protein of unknown function (DUF3237)